MTDWKKPDGSALTAQKTDVAERNDAARKIARAERQKRELAEDKARAASEAKQNASLRKSSERSGKATRR
jgi:hypothetical protein